MARRILAAMAAVLYFGISPAGAQQRQPVRYTVSFPAPLTHYVEVDAVIPTDGQARVDLMMAVWTPGSYLVREYSRNVESLIARNAKGETLHIEKTRKNRWRVDAPGSPSVMLHYRVYCHEMSVRTNWVDDEFALLNGAATYITRLSERDRPYEVQVRLPQGWTQSLSMMAATQPNTFRAPDFDALVDGPIVAGNPAVYQFTVAGKPHYLVDIAERGTFDGAQAARDIEKIVQQTTTLWRTVPYERYAFFNVIGGQANGLEHKNGAVLNTPRDSTTTREAYLTFLSLASHEFFHAWNVKRLRPTELGPFDYENEVYTPSLWFVEGVTDYDGDLQVARAGISTRDEYLSSLSSAIAGLQTTPGRLVQPVEAASYDAWIKYYRPDENSMNSSVSYYEKGAVIGFLLDARIRRVTANARSLDDLMRMMYQRFSGERGYAASDLRTAAADVVGTSVADDLRHWLARALDSTDELDYAEALSWFGLQFDPLPAKPRVSLGVGIRLDGPRTVVTSVRRGSPAGEAGIDIGDEILAVNGDAVAGKLAERLAPLAPGTKAVLTVNRRGDKQDIAVTMAAEPSQLWHLSVRPDATPAQRSNLEMWMNGRGA